MSARASKAAWVLETGLRWFHITRTNERGAGEIICSVAIHRPGEASLIAAAPELSAAAQEALDFIGSYFGPVASDDPAGWSDGDARGVHAKLTAAINKAEGRS